jgi:glycosyltransferase involved in cell wall biosynthesis
LYIFGKGPEDKYILKYIKSNNLTKNIFLLGFEKNKKNIYSKINVLIHPTFGEGVPMTILEAILTSTFIIASKVSGIKDILDHKESGLLFNPFDENDLIEQLKFFKNNNVLVKNMIENAKKKVLKEYDIDVGQVHEYRQ